MTHLRLAALAAATLATVMAAAPASAENLAFIVNTKVFSYSADHTAVVITTTGLKIVNFSVPVAGLISVTYTAECSFASPTPNAWAGVDILIDGVAASPTNQDDALCAGHDTTPAHHFSTHSIIGARLLGAGSHTVQVIGRIGFGVGTVRYDDSSILIER